MPYAMTYALCYHNKKAKCITFTQHDFKWASS